MFKGLKSLKTLVLNDNKIQVIQENTFSNLTSLEYLFIASNRIVNVKIDAFKGLAKLKELYLGSNQIDELNDGFFNGLILDLNGQFYRLNLIINPIKYISKDLGFELSRLDEFHLSNGNTFSALNNKPQSVI